MLVRGFPGSRPFASFGEVSSLISVVPWSHSSRYLIMHGATILRYHEAVQLEALPTSVSFKQASIHTALPFVAPERGRRLPFGHGSLYSRGEGCARTSFKNLFSSWPVGQDFLKHKGPIVHEGRPPATNARKIVQAEGQQAIIIGQHSQCFDDSQNFQVFEDWNTVSSNEAHCVGDDSTSGTVREQGTVICSSKNKARPEKRRKPSCLGRNMQGGIPDLLAVPGIGPKNLEKFIAKGIEKIDELKQLYRDKFVNDTSGKMVKYLQSSVGILHKNHAERITSYVKHCVDEELKEKVETDKGNDIKHQKKVTICVEGNISVGKTTLLQKLANEMVELRDLVEVVPEPVDKWKDVGPDHFNLLDAFYNEPERYAYTFQNYVFATRLMKEQETAKGLKPLRLMERSIFSDRLVFVRAVHEAKWMSELELRIYESWFDPFISALPGLVPDGFIYLRASPCTCLQRLHMRNRPEERGVTLEYLRGLHEKHEQCFLPSGRTGGVLSVSRWPFGPHKLSPPPSISNCIVYLEGDHLHSSIQKVPALILDCEPPIDFNKDVEAQAEYAQQITDFYRYIQSNKEFDTTQPATQSGSSSLFGFPHTCGLLRPDGSPLLPGSTLSSLELSISSTPIVQ